MTGSDAFPFAASSTLWAMHPAFLGVLVHGLAFDGLLPDPLRRVATRANGFAAPKASDPVRDGATLIVPIHGILAPRGMIAGATAYETIADQVHEATTDRRIGAIVLDVRSPGETVWKCAEAADAIFAARAAKPIAAVASPFCFSGAYWLATQAGRFYATRSGEVGSVGVRTSHTDTSGFERKIGIVSTLIASDPDKIAAHSHAPLSDRDRAHLQSGIDESNRAFVRAIARGRRMRVADVARVHGTGRTFGAQRAAAQGATDGVATLRDAVSVAGSSRPRLDLMRAQVAMLDQLAQNLREPA